jgi:hypothetical protein
MRIWHWVTWVAIGAALLSLGRFGDDLPDETRAIAWTAALIVVLAFGWVTLLGFKSGARNIDKEMADVDAAMRRSDESKR